MTTNNIYLYHVISQAQQINFVHVFYVVDPILGLGRLSISRKKPQNIDCRNPRWKRDEASQTLGMEYICSPMDFICSPMDFFLTK